MGEKIHFLPTFYSFYFSDSLDSEQLLRTLPGVEVGIGLAVGLGHHCEDEDGVERGDGGKVKEDSVRTKQRHEWFGELEDMSEQVSIVLIFEGVGWTGTWTATKMNANWVVIKVPVTRAERSAGNHSPG